MDLWVYHKNITSDDRSLGGVLKDWRMSDTSCQHAGHCGGKTDTEENYTTPQNYSVQCGSRRYQAIINRTGQTDRIPSHHVDMKKSMT